MAKLPIWDKMILLDDDDKQFIREIGYMEISGYLGKTRTYIRGLCSKGDRYMRESDLVRVRKLTQGEL